MIVEKNKVVSFSYELKLQNDKGESIQQVKKSKPLKILFGRGNLLEHFEENIAGLKKGDEFEFVLKSEKSYGPYNKDAVAEYDKTIFTGEGGMDEDQLEVGNFIPMETEDGTPFNGKVIAVSKDKITIDFNHPLAGKDLFFKGQILGVRDATPQEIETGKVATRTKHSEK